MAEDSDDAVYAPPGDSRTAEDVESSEAEDPLDALRAGAPDPTAKAPPRPSLGIRVAVTLGAALLATLLVKIPLPGIDTDEVERFAGAGENFSVAALGVMPIVSAYWLVELVALAVPAWRRLRHGGPQARAKLDRATAVVALALALFQGYGIALAFAGRALLVGSALGGVLSIVITLAAGTFLLWAVALAVSRYGLGNGVVWLLVVGSLRSGAARLVEPPSPAGMLGAFGDSSRPSVAQTAAAGAVLVVATVLVAHAANAGRIEKRGARPVSIRIPVPASGLAPTYLATSLVALPVSLAALHIPMPAFDPRGAAALAVSAVLAALLAIAFGFAFHRPSRVTALLQRAGVALPSPDRTLVASRLVWTAMPATIAYVLCALFAGHSGVGTSLIALPLAAAWLVDAIRDQQASRANPTLVTVWTEERPYAAAVAAAALRANGIASHASGLALRSLLQFGAGYAPMELRVPAAEAARARAYLAAALPEPAAARDAADPVPGAPAAPPRWLTGSLAAVAMLTLALAALQMVPSRVLSPPSAAELERRRALLQLTLIDDEDDPLAPLREAPDLPRGVRLQQESSPTLQGGSHSETYALAVLYDGESLDALAIRIKPFVDSIVVPSGARIAFGEHSEWDGDAQRLAVVGLRTYVLRGEPILTGADVVSAEARPDYSLSPPGAPATRPDGWVVSIALTKEAGEVFRKATAANIKRRIAIVMQGRVMSAPLILQEIGGGNLVLTMGAGSPEEQQASANRLAKALGGS